jgi:carbonyl reductase 1
VPKCYKPTKDSMILMINFVFFRWWSKETVAVVTGANSGIGYEIARQLAVHGLHVVLTSRDIGRSQGAAYNLQQEGLSVQPCQLDITDVGLVQSFASWIQFEHGGIDILVRVSLRYWYP